MQISEITERKRAREQQIGFGVWVDTKAKGISQVKAIHIKLTKFKG